MQIGLPTGYHGDTLNDLGCFELNLDCSWGLFSTLIKFSKIKKEMVKMSILFPEAQIDVFMQFLLFEPEAKRFSTFHWNYKKLKIIFCSKMYENIYFSLSS